MRKLICVIVLSFLVSACASEPQKPLAAQLEGKTPAEKQEILRLACLNEAEYSTNLKKAYSRSHTVKHWNVDDTGDTVRLKALCREMTDQYSAGEIK